MRGGVVAGSDLGYKLTMTTLLVDRNGEMHAPQSPAMRRRLSVDPNHIEVTEFLVRNAGYVAVRLADGNAFLQICPHRTSYVTYATAIGLLDRHVTRRIAMRWYDGVWHDEISANLPAISRRILKLMTERREFSSDRVYTQARDVASLPDQHPFRDLLGLWSERSGRLDLNDHRALLHDRLLDKYCLIERSQNDSELLFALYGEGLVIYRPEWVRQIIGRRVDEQPDMQYGRMVADGWRQAMLADRPTLTDADAMIHDPTKDQPWRSQYTRMTLPIYDGSGRHLMLSATVLDPSINLMLKPSHEPECVIDHPH